MVYNTIQHLPPPHQPPPQPHTLSVYTCTVHLLWEEGGGGSQREGRWATIHKYSSFANGGNSSQTGSKKIPTMSECISSLLYLLNTCLKVRFQVNFKEKPTFRVRCLYSSLVHDIKFVFASLLFGKQLCQFYPAFKVYKTTLFQMLNAC
jgi:hypothetical protein